MVQRKFKSKVPFLPVRASPSGFVAPSNFWILICGFAFRHNAFRCLNGKHTYHPLLKGLTMCCYVIPIYFWCESLNKRLILTNQNSTSLHLYFSGVVRLVKIPLNR